MGDLNPVAWAIRPLKKYAVFSGRAPRAEYWWYALGITIVGVILWSLDARFAGPIYGQFGPLRLVFMLALAIPGLAVLVRRLHDTDRSGWWALVRAPSYAVILAGSTVEEIRSSFKELPGPLVALAVVLVLGWLVAALLVFIFAVNEGTQESNRYGSDPYGPDELEEVFA